MKVASEVPGIASREMALLHLRNVLIRHRRFSERGRESEDLSPADAARAKRLAETVLRNLRRADAVLDEFIPHRPNPSVMNVMRLAVTEIFADGTAPYAVVDQAVRMAKTSGSSRRLAGLVNAVLRRAVDGGAEKWNAAPPKKLPRWLARKVKTAVGAKALRDIESVHERVPPLDITPRQASDAHRLAQLLGATMLPTGNLRLPVCPKVSALPEFESGTWWVQDAAAAFPVRLLGNLAGKTVLDLFAAPGGKSMQCAASGAEVTAIDRSASRLQILGRNFERTGLECAAVCADALMWQPDTQFDVVIVDAPCTATGTIRRNPDLPHALNTPSKALAALVENQRLFLEKAASMVRHGGKVLYCVCSLLPDEGDDVITRCADRAGLRIATADGLAEGLESGWRTSEGGYRIRPDFWPELGGMDGFYVAVLEKA